MRLPNLKWKTLLASIVSITAFIIAINFIIHLFGSLPREKLLSSISNINIRSAIFSVSFTMLSYFLLTVYDAMAIRALGKTVPYRTVAAASFTNYALIHNFGFPLLTGAVARYRFYSVAGLSNSDIARVIAFTMLTFWLGVILLVGLALSSGGGEAALSYIPAVAQKSVGALILFLIFIYVVCCFSTKSSFSIGGGTFRLPQGGISVAQFALAAADMMAAAAAFFTLVPSAQIGMFWAFLASYVLAMGASLLSNAPGGLGIFEAVMLLTLPTIDRTTLLSALIAYRVIYYLAPLAMSAIVLLYHEFVTAPKHRSGLGASPIRSARTSLPSV